MTTLIGKYQFDMAENVDEYLEGLRSGQVLRKSVSIEYNFLPDTHEWEITMEEEAPLIPRTVRFKLGQPFEDETYDARKCRTTARLDGMTKLIFEQECDEGPPVTVTMEVFPPCPHGQLTEEWVHVNLVSGVHEAKLYYRTGGEQGGCGM